MLLPIVYLQDYDILYGFPFFRNVTVAVNCLLEQQSG